MKDKFKKATQKEIEYLTRISDSTVSKEEIKILANKSISSHLHEDLDCSGNFILTADIEKYNKRVEWACCGINQNTFVINGKYFYYHMDYGH